MILDFDQYMTSCYKHLSSKQSQPDGSEKPYYSRVQPEVLDLVKSQISNLLEEGFDNEYISKDEYEAMDPSEKGPGKFYELFKNHKEHNPGETPPERPIISGSGSVTENLGLFVEHSIKDLANKHETFLQDTPDFLRAIENLNENGPLPDNSIIVTIDLSALYTNIPQDEGIEAVTEALQERNNKDVPTEFIIRMLEIVLKHNVFEFNNELFIQLIGTAMGSRPAPSYANLFMARKIDKKIVELATRLEGDNCPINFLKRFLDDVFLIYTGTIDSLHRFLDELNNIHLTIKFTMSHTTPPNVLNPTCGCKQAESLPFLDTSCQIIDGKIVTDLYRKETDRNQYLLTSSCHSAHVTENIPFSLALRIVRICSLPEAMEKVLQK